MRFDGLMSRWTMPRACAARHRVGEVDHVVELLLQLERRADLDHAVEGVALDVLHRDERLAGVLAGVVDADDVGVGQLAGDADFPLEPLARVHVVAEAEQLDGDVAADDGVAGEVDDAHAASAQAANDLVALDRLWRGFHERGAPAPGRIIAQAGTASTGTRRVGPDGILRRKRLTPSHRCFDHPCELEHTRKMPSGRRQRSSAW